MVLVQQRKGTGLRNLDIVASMRGTLNGCGNAAVSVQPQLRCINVPYPVQQYRTLLACLRKDHGSASAVRRAMLFSYIKVQPIVRFQCSGAVIVKHKGFFIYRVHNGTIGCACIIQQEGVRRSCATSTLAMFSDLYIEQLL